MALRYAGILADGQLPTTQGTLYICPEGATAYVRLINLANISAGAETAMIFVRSGPTARRFYRVVMAAGDVDRACGKDEVLVLGPGDVIEGVTSVSATAVDYVICGVVDEA